MSSTMSQETLLDRISQLSELPTALLVEMWTITQRGAEVPEKHGQPWRGKIVTTLAPNAAVTWQQTDDPDADIRKDGIALLVKNFPKMYREGSGMTSMSYKTLIDFVYKLPDDEVVNLYEPDALQDKFKEFGEYFVSLTGGDKEKVMKHSEEILAKFKSLMFTTINKRTLDIICSNVAFDAATTLVESGTEPTNISYGYPNLVHSKIAFGNDIDCSTDEMFMKICPDWTAVCNTPIVAHTVVVEQEDGTLAEEVTDSTGLPVPNIVSNLNVRIVENGSASADNIRELGNWKRMPTSRFTAWSWRTLRKDIGLSGRTGRVEIWIMENPGENPSQNKYLKYKSPTVCEESNEGSFPDETMPGVHFTNHPYGQITLIV